MSEQVEMPARQAGAIYLKNTVSNYWEPVKLDETTTTPVEALGEQDKQTIRDNLIEAVIHSPDPIRNQLVICVRQIAQADFPDKWTAIIEKVHHFIQTNDMNQWYGSLQAFYQLCKVFEYDLILFFYLFSVLYSTHISHSLLKIQTGQGSWALPQSYANYVTHVFGAFVSAQRGSVRFERSNSETNP